MATTNGTKTAGGVSRRGILRQAAATASTVALVQAVKAAFPSGVHAQAAGPETTEVLLGFIALTDAAALFAAKEKGFFDKHGMTDAQVLKQASWGSTRDNFVLGSGSGGIDGGHMLTPLPYLMHSGKIIQGGQSMPSYLLARCQVDGECISVSNEFADLKLGLDAGPFKEALAKKKASGKPVKAAHTFPMGTHDVEIRYWLAAGGIDPDKDIELITVPPPQMVANMKVGSMDCFCVSDPWHLQLIHQGIGYTAITLGELWALKPDKSYGFRADWVDKNPKAAKATLMAIMEAQMWCDKNHEELAEIMSKRQWINVPVKDMADRVKGRFDYGIPGKVVENSPHIMKFWRDNASYPWKSHDEWFIYENIRWGKWEPTLDVKALVDQVVRDDLWREAATELGVPANEIPTARSRGKEHFFDGKVFDPDDPMAYLKSLDLKRVS